MHIKVFLFLVVLVGYFAARAEKTSKTNIELRKIASLNFYKKDNCEKKYLDMFDGLGVVHDWKRIADPEKDVRLYRTETYTFAVWVEVRVKNEMLVSITKSQSAQDTVFIKSATSCDFKKQILQKTKFNKKGLTDDKLSRLISKGSGIIYIWSPRMTYSMSELITFEKVAKKLNIQFNAYADPYAEDEMVAEGRKHYRFSEVYENRVTSFDLYMRQYFNHYPRTFVYSNGMLHDQYITGVMREQDLIKEITGRINEPF
jgi:hypothetical protein